MSKRGPLSGITVLDMSRVLAGPYCTMILADLGARVIKVEKPGTGDDSRAFGPFIGKESAYFMCFNRGKESIVLDLKAPRDREVFAKLLDEADVLVENFRPGVMDRLGYGAERLRRTHPRLVYSSISGFGGTGPYSEHAAYDMVVQAMGGVMSLTGWPDGQPSRVGTSIGDLGAALFAAIGIVSALYSRTTNAQGTRVDVGMLDCQAALIETAIARYDVEGKVPQRTGDRHASLAPFETFAAADGRFVIAAGNDNLFLALADALRAPELSVDARFLSNDNRVAHREALCETIDAITSTLTVEHWLHVLDEAGVPCAPINTIDKLLTHEQLLARNMIIKVRGRAGELRTAGNPIKMSAFPDPDPQVPRRAPMLNEDREAILHEFLPTSPIRTPAAAGAAVAAVGDYGTVPDRLLA